MKVAERVKFDRLNPEPPKGLYQLRNKGHWRRWRAQFEGSIAYSDALANAIPHVEKRRLFVDAGCGHSPDAALAIKYARFDRAMKVDLWKPYCDAGDFFAKELRQFDGPSVRFIQGDICKLTDYVRHGIVDCIVCNAVIDLLDSNDRMLFYCEASDALAPGGILSIVHVPLVMGHGDWKHGRNEFRSIHADGYANFEPIRLTRQNVVLRRVA